MMEEIERRAMQRELETLREILRALLDDRFGPLPPECLQRIEATFTPDRLRAAAVQVLHISKVEDLKL
jgi:hypothetical protein